MVASLVWRLNEREGRARPTADDRRVLSGFLNRAGFSAHESISRVRRASSALRSVSRVRSMCQFFPCCLCSKKMPKKGCTAGAKKMRVCQWSWQELKQVEIMWSWHDQCVQQHVLVSLDSGRRLRRPSSIGARPSSCSLSLAPPWLASHTKKAGHVWFL